MQCAGCKADVGLYKGEQAARPEKQADDQVRRKAVQNSPDQEIPRVRHDKVPEGAHERGRRLQAEEKGEEGRL